MSSSSESNDAHAMRQVGFLEVVALPLFRSLAAIVPGSAYMLNGAMENYYMWRSEITA